MLLLAALCVLAISGVHCADAQSVQQPAISASNSTDAFAARVEALRDTAAAAKAHWGIFVADAATGKTLYDLNSGQFFTPASTTKLFTTALALAKLGPDYRFRTTLESAAKPDSHERLKGDLFLVGRSAPDLTNRRYPYDPHLDREGAPERILAEMVDALVAQGVRRIDGDIVVDDSAFEDRPYPRGWDIEDVKYDFGAPVTALVINDNIFFTDLSPAFAVGAKARADLAPPLADLYVDNAVVTGARHGEPRIRIVWQLGSQTVRLAGSIPLGGKTQTLAVANPSPCEYAARLLRFLLLQRGIKISGQARVLEAPQESPPAPQGPRNVLVEHLSPPLSEIVTMTNKNSENLYAELLLRAVAYAATGFGSLDAGLQIEQDFLRQAGVPVEEVALADGSGLSHGNLVTPAATVALLRYAATQPWGADYRASLPIAGEDGTLSMQMKNTPAAGRVQAKTGTLEHSKAIAGYTTALSGRALVFAMFASQYSMTTHDAMATLDGICAAMVEEIPAAGNSN